MAGAGRPVKASAGPYRPSRKRCTNARNSRRSRAGDPPAAASATTCPCTAQTRLRTVDVRRRLDQRPGRRGGDEQVGDQPVQRRRVALVELGVPVRLQPAAQPQRGGLRPVLQEVHEHVHQVVQGLPGGLRPGVQRRPGRLGGGLRAPPARRRRPGRSRRRRAAPSYPCGGRPWRRRPRRRRRPPAARRRRSPAGRTASVAAASTTSRVGRRLVARGADPGRRRGMVMAAILPLQSSNRWIAGGVRR